MGLCGTTEKSEGYRDPCGCRGLWPLEARKSLAHFRVELRGRDRVEEEKAHLARHPIGRFGAPIDIAYGALFLASDESGFVTGSSLMVDGGYTAV